MFLVLNLYYKYVRDWLIYTVTGVEQTYNTLFSIYTEDTVVHSAAFMHLISEALPHEDCGTFLWLLSRFSGSLVYQRYSGTSSNPGSVVRV